VVTPACVFRVRTLGASRRPAFPAPFFLDEGETDSKLGRPPPRDRECMSAPVTKAHSHP